jgi:hypothetical protein
VRRLEEETVDDNNGFAKIFALELTIAVFFTFVPDGLSILRLNPDSV